MTRFLLAAAAALALWAQPAIAGDCGHCKDCPHHKTAQADDKGKKDDKAATVACPCAGEGKECKCGANCQCAHCAQHKHGKQHDQGEQPKKS